MDIKTYFLCHIMQLINFFIVLLVSVSITGCRTANHAHEEMAAAPTASLSTLPSELEIVCGQGGGFTGAWTGFTFREDGGVWSWTGRAAKENAQLIGRVDIDSIRVLWSMLEAMQFFDLQKEDYGNMTAIVEARGDGEAHRVSWPPKLQGFEPMETPLDSFYVSCTRMGERLTNR